MKRLTVFLAAAALAAFNAAAVQIDGSITISGGAKLDAPLATANKVTTWSNTKVESVDGDFDTFANPGDAVTMTAPWIFDPSTPTPLLWSVDGFTFNLDSSSIVFQNASFLIITGNGTVNHAGFTPTPGIWNFTSQAPSAKKVFSFSASTEAVPSSVPDGGNTLVLLGLGMTALAFAHRRITAAN